MNDLIDRLRVSAEPVGKLLLEAADALQNAQARIAELTETLRAMVEIGWGRPVSFLTAQVARQDGALANGRESGRMGAPWP